MTSIEKYQWEQIHRKVCDRDDLAGEKEQIEVTQYLYLRWKAQTDLFFLGNDLLGWGRYIDKKNGRKRIDPTFHREMCNFLQDDEDALILEPRDSMKSTWMKLSVLQRLLRDPLNANGLWSVTSKLGRSQLRSIKGYAIRLRQCGLFDVEIPPRDKWEKDADAEWTMWRDPDSDFIPQEYQVEAWGVDSGVVGRHYDYHWYDDIIDYRSVRTAARLDTTRQWWSAMNAVKQITGCEKVIGTHYHHMDIYSLIKTEGYFDRIITRAAIEGGKPVYSYYTLPDLQKKQTRMLPYDWSCQYMNNPLPKEDQMFIGPYPTWGELPENREYYITVDPATGKSGGDEQGICIACISREKPGFIYFVEAEGYKLPLERLAEVIIDKMYRYRPRLLGVESGLMESLRYIIHMKREEREKTDGFIPLDYREIPPGKMPKADKINQTLGVVVREQRALFSPYMQRLFNQMDRFNPHSEKNDDDIIDAASMMIMLVPTFAQSHWKNFSKPVITDNYMEWLFKKKRDVSWANTMN